MKLGNLKSKFKTFKEDESGNLSWFVIFVIFAITAMFFFGVMTPLMIDANTKFYQAGEDILQDSQETINSIQDPAIKQQLNDSIQAAQQSTADQISILTFFYQYGWIFIVVIFALVFAILARRQTEREIY